MDIIRSASIFEEVEPIYQQYQEDLSNKTINYLHEKFFISKKESFTDSLNSTMWFRKNIYSTFLFCLQFALRWLYFQSYSPYITDMKEKARNRRNSKRVNFENVE